MSRASYCREQAALCREMAKQISNRADAKVLHDQADNYDTEARTLENEQKQPGAGKS